jgi:hypothetical protein
MKHNTKIILGSIAGLALLTSNVLAAGNGTASANEIIAGLGAFGTFASVILTYVKWGSIFVAIIAFLVLYATGQLSKVAHKAENVLNAREGMKAFLVDSVLLIFGFILLFSVVIPLINSFI